MSVRKRTVQRTPNLGLKIRMVKDVAPAACCVPEIGPARWYNPASGAYDLETVVVKADYYGEMVTDEAGDWRGLVTAQVTGDLCDCAVTWDYEKHLFDTVKVAVQTPGRGLAVGLDKYSDDYGIQAGVLTATATVTCRDGAIKVLPTIYLIMVDTYNGCGG